jgi:hypothetical protein
MGLLWRLFAPKPLKKARRTVRKATHPAHTAARAVTPKPVKQLQRAAHPLSLAELKIEDATVNALKGRGKPQHRRTQAVRNTGAAPTRNIRQEQRSRSEGGHARRHDGTAVTILRSRLLAPMGADPSCHTIIILDDPCVRKTSSGVVSHFFLGGTN